MKKNIISVILICALCGCPDPIESTTPTNTEQAPGEMQQNGPSKMESDPNQAKLNCEKENCNLAIAGKFQYAGTATPAPCDDARVVE